MTEWIKCSDRMPPQTTRWSEPDKDYLGYDGYIHVVSYDSHTEYEKWRGNDGCSRDITHWAELPEAPYD